MNIHQQQGNMAAATRDGAHDIFPLFDLPPELRDFIYNNLLTTSKEVNVVEDCNHDYLHARARNICATKLLLVSKQFRQEYQERSLKTREIDINERVCEDFEISSTGPSPCLVPVHLAGCQVLNLGIVVDCGATHVGMDDNPGCKTCNDVRLHLNWIPGLLARFGRLKRLHVKVHIEPQALAEDKRAASLAHLNRLTALPQVDLVTVYTCDWVRGTQKTWAYDKGGVKALVWSRADAGFMEVEKLVNSSVEETSVEQTSVEQTSVEQTSVEQTSVEETVAGSGEE